MEPRRFAIDPVPDPEPLQFVLEGHRLSNQEPWEELFTVLPSLPPQSLSNLAYAAVLDDAGLVDWDVVAVVRFLRQVIVKDDEARWDVLVFDKDRVVDVHRLREIMEWITREKAQRPTGLRPSSPDGSQNGTNGSGAASSEPVTETST